MLAPGEGLGRTTLSLLLCEVVADGLGVRTLVASLSVDRERVRLPVPPEQRSKLDLSDLLRDLDGFVDLRRKTEIVCGDDEGASAGDLNRRHAEERRRCVSKHALASRVLRGSAPPRTSG